MKPTSVAISQEEYAQFKELLKRAKAQEAERLKAEKEAKRDMELQKFTEKADPYYTKIYNAVDKLKDMAFDIVFDTAETSKGLAKDAVTARKELVKLQEQLKKVEIAVEALEQYAKKVAAE